jgi:hypothetical protein
MKTKSLLKSLLLTIAIAMAGICATQTASAQAISFDIDAVSASTADYSYGIDGYGHNVVTLTTNGGYITIDGGTVNTYSSAHAGIGGGTGDGGGIVTINVGLTSATNTMTRRQETQHLIAWRRELAIM